MKPLRKIRWRIQRIALTRGSSRRGSPQFPDPKRCGRCCRRDDGLLCVGHGEEQRRLPQRCRRRPQASTAKRVAAAALCGPGCREEGAGAGVDDRGRVLQGGPGAFQLAHDWSDAHHLRFLPASHQTAGRQTGQGDEASGEPVRKPQRDRQGTRHGTSRARRAGRERTGNGRPEISGRPARQA